MRPLNKVRALFIVKESGKEVLNKKRLFIVTGFIFVLGVCWGTVWKAKKDSSVLVNSTIPIEQGKSEGKPPVGSQVSEVVSRLFQASEQKEHEGKNRRSRSIPRKTTHIKYKAPQVIERKGANGFARGLPLGTNMLGRLLTAIDTRETTQLYKVLLPNGGRDKNGGYIPGNSILFGTISYPGKGRKVFIQFSKALLPDGKEVKLNAQALNLKEHSPGIEGDFHGKATERIVSTLGLTMLSTMTDTLTKRTGKGEVLTPKATAKNALYQGISKVSEMEAKRQATELSHAPEYVTIPAGQDMIVNLLETYYSGEL